MPIGKVEIGENIPDLIGCEIPTTDILKIEHTKSDWTAKLERQEENINQCLSLEDENDHYVLQPGENLTVHIYLKKDNPVFENLHWHVIFTRWPTNLSGTIVKNDEHNKNTSLQETQNSDKCIVGEYIKRNCI